MSLPGTGAFAEQRVKRWPWLDPTDPVDPNSLAE